MVAVLQETDRIYHPDTGEEIPPEDVDWRGTLKQNEFLAASEDEVLYGGAAGGGKTDALVIDAMGLQYEALKYPWYRAIIFRQTYDQLTEVIDRGRMYYDSVDEYDDYKENKHIFQFKSGAKIIMAYATHRKHLDNHQGKEYQYIGWEELTQWATKEFYDYLLTRCRASTRVSAIPTRVRATCNPGGPGHHWVKQYFNIPNNGAPTVFTETVDIDIPGVKPSTESFTRRFIPARLVDNPHLMHDRRYLARLSLLPDRLKKALLEGRWDLIEGQFFSHFDPKVHVIKAFTPPPEWPRWRAMDWGFRKPYAIGWFTMNPDGQIFMYRELYGYGGEPDVGSQETIGTVSTKIKKSEQLETKAGIEFRRNPADTNIWARAGTSAAEKEITGAKIFKQKGINWVKAIKGPGSRIAGWAVMHELMKDRKFFVMDNCTHWIRTVPDLQIDPDNPEDLLTDMEDHAADMTRYSLMSRHQKPDRKGRQKPTRHKPGTFNHLVEMDELERKRNRRRHPYLG